MKNEEQLLEQRELREQLAERVEVLEKVKSILLVPQTDVATVKQVAEFYEVGEEAIKTLIKENREELTEDGLKNLTGAGTKEYFERFSKNPSNVQGGFMLDNMRFSNRGNLLLTRRAILRVGMLLRDSKVAKEVRTQLLNIEEKTSDDIKVHDIDEEQKLAIEIGMSYMSGNIEQFAQASTKMVAFKNRHIDKLRQDNKALAGEILKWEDRSKMVFAIRKLALILHKPVGYVWNDLYKEIKYKHHIDIKLRGDKPYIKHVKSEEWSKVIQTFSALCEVSQISPSEILNNLEVVK